MITVHSAANEKKCFTFYQPPCKTKTISIDRAMKCVETVSIIGSWMSPRNESRFSRSHITALYASSLKRRNSCRRWLPTSFNFCSWPFTSAT